MCTASRTPSTPGEASWPHVTPRGPQPGGTSTVLESKQHARWGPSPEDGGRPPRKRSRQRPGVGTRAVGPAEWPGSCLRALGSQGGTGVTCRPSALPHPRVCAGQWRGMSVASSGRSAGTGGRGLGAGLGSEAPGSGAWRREGRESRTLCGRALGRCVYICVC